MTFTSTTESLLGSFNKLKTKPKTSVTITRIPTRSLKNGLETEEMDKKGNVWKLLSEEYF